MTDDKPRQKPTKRKFRAMKILEGTAEGKTQEVIAEELGICRQTVSEILNSEQAQKIIERVEDRYTRMLEKIADRFENIIDKGSDENVIKVGLAIGRTKGVVNEKQEITHKFPPPTVIRYDGKDMMKMGVLSEEDEDDSDDRN